MKTPDEIWKNIPGHEGYQVSNLGKVRSLNYGRTGKIQNLKIKINKYGYRCVSLRNTQCNISVLSALAFLNHKPSPGLVVDHINNDKKDDRLENLQVITVRKNTVKDQKSTKYPLGVSKNIRGGRFNSRIEIDGKRKYLGSFDTPNEAHQAYLNELKKYENTSTN